MATEMIDQAVVDLMLGQVAGATTVQIETALPRLVKIAEGGQPVTDGRGVTMTPETAREIVSRLRAIIAERQAAANPAPAAPASTPAGYTRIRITATGAHFGKAVAAAKGRRGRYDGASRTWLIPSDSNFLNAPGAYGWAIVERN